MLQGMILYQGDSQWRFGVFSGTSERAVYAVTHNDSLELGIQEFDFTRPFTYQGNNYPALPPGQLFLGDDFAPVRDEMYPHFVNTEPTRRSHRWLNNTGFITPGFLVKSCPVGSSVAIRNLNHIRRIYYELVFSEDQTTNPPPAMEPQEHPDSNPEHEALAAVAATQRFGMTFSGAPVENLDEFTRVIQPYLVNQDERFADRLWQALFRDDPESYVAGFIDNEPVVLGLIGFTPLVVSEAAPAIQIPAQAAVPSMIVRAAAGILLSGELGNHFHYTEDRRLVINTDNPPTIEQGYEIIQRTFQIKETGARLDNFSMWVMGELVDECMRYFGEDRFDISSIVGATGKAYNTLVCALGTFKAFGGKKRNLPYTNHKEAFYWKTTPENKEWVLDEAERRGLSSKQQRKVQSYVGLYGFESLDADEIKAEDNESFLARMETRSVNRNYIFQLRNNWYRCRCPFELLPAGCAPVFNADTMARVDINPDQPQLLTAWEPPIQIALPRGHVASVENRREEAAANDDELHSEGGNPNESEFMVSDPIPTPDEVLSISPGLAPPTQEHPRPETVLIEDVPF